MEKVVYFGSIGDYNRFNLSDTLHPLVSIVDLSNANPREGHKMIFEIYCVILKEAKCGDIMYGNHNYDYQDGTLVFFAPGQVVDVTGDARYQPTGIALVFHPDLLLHTSLMRRMSEFSFFSYHTHEALHLSEKERKIITECFDKIRHELHNGVDKHSKMLITSTIELFLNYCIRFYDRQFITRDHVNRGVVDKFERLLSNYFHSEQPFNKGLPSVAFCAEKLNFSANYFGDLVKKDLGITAQEYIQSQVIQLAKERICYDEKSISEIAYGLGFKYPQHFTRLFKQKVGLSPLEFRSINSKLGI